MSLWLALAIGNSRLHWAAFSDSRLLHNWDSDYWTAAAIAQFAADPASAGLSIASEVSLQAPVPLAIASVVPAQTDLWQQYPAQQILTLADVPLAKMYPTLGIDRALTLWGAICSLGAPVLVIDAGTALTFTAADRANTLLGGAILPGLRLQQQALAQDTAALPLVALQPDLNLLPPRWATDTPTAIRSGILYTLLASLQDFACDWLLQEPEGAIALTGGDSALLHQALSQQNPALAARIHRDPALIFRGIPALRNWSLI
ncbi:pantothenate kinase [Thermoleptolyngbya sichuanensis A183]|uniref:Type III pantothenate kinase n=1 Tax=Thermoleptolyngbya sichuanensis A183 TaxID=2737172 RepID=A0A6M8B6P5_9CYAN|nr:MULTISPECIES: pantothenate kinase [Thermoleptolyngbya]QKD82168.1 pantothenate kinase [Thermoleptolyngbya sichuanensis A183]